MEPFGVQERKKNLTQTDLQNKEADVVHITAMCRESLSQKTQLQCSDSLSSFFRVLAIS